MPALFTRPAMPPPPCSTAQAQAWSAMAGMRSKSVASNGRTSDVLPASFATSFSAARLRPDRMSLAPALPSATASAAPLPDDAPVIHQVLPSNMPCSLCSSGSRIACFNRLQPGGLRRGPDRIEGRQDERPPLQRRADDGLDGPALPVPPSPADQARPVLYRDGDLAGHHPWPARAAARIRPARRSGGVATGRQRAGATRGSREDRRGLRLCRNQPERRVSVGPGAVGTVRGVPDARAGAGGGVRGGDAPRGARAGDGE